MANTINPDYMIAPSLQEYFVDKITGLPLANGMVYFYSDVNRTVLKPIYTLVDSAPYTYVQLPNPVPLSAVGTFTDGNNNDVLPYYFPFTDSSAMTVELYYIKVYDMNGTLQFTREAYPNFALNGSSNGDTDLFNYIPNGQFLAHNNQPADDTTTPKTVAGQIVNNATGVYPIAPGGWFYERSIAATDVDLVTFPANPLPTDNPVASPIFSVEVKCNSAGNATYKRLAIRWNGVNTFSNSAGSQFTFSFWGENLSGGTINLDLNLIRFFGTGGGSGTVIDSLTTFTITNAFLETSATVVFPDNASEVMGTAGDDYIELALDFPINSAFDVKLTNFLLTPGVVATPVYPYTTEDDVFARGVAGSMPIPDPNGYDLYCPLVYTKTGTMFSRADIGKIYSTGYYTPRVGELLCDGTQYETVGYSSDGIPYGRLQAVVYDANPAVNAPIFGTGSYFISTYIATGPASTLRITTNTPGAVTAFADGLSPTGFGFAQAHTGTTSDFTGYTSGAGNTVIALANTIGAPFGVTSAGTSGFTVALARSNSNQYQQLNISNISSPAGLAGTYFRFSSTTTQYYMWFKVNGTGADPAPGGTGILLNLIASYDSTDVTNLIREAISGYQNGIITTTAASTVPQSSYWTFQTKTATGTQNYYVWYNKDGGGTDPNVAGALAVQVNILTADANTVVASKTQTALNSRYFATPDLRGRFIRVYDAGQIWDYGAGTRLNQLETFAGNQIGTLEVDNNLSHFHTITTAVNGGGAVHVIADAGGTTGTSVTNSTGGPEAVVINIALQYVIKY